MFTPISGKIKGLENHNPGQIRFYLKFFQTLGDLRSRNDLACFVVWGGRLKECSFSFHRYFCRTRRQQDDSTMDALKRTSLHTVFDIRKNHFDYNEWKTIFHIFYRIIKSLIKKKSPPFATSTAHGATQTCHGLFNGTGHISNTERRSSANKRFTELVAHGRILFRPGT